MSSIEYCGIDDVLTFYENTHALSGGDFDADTPPTYRVYEGTTDTPILTGSMAKQDDANTLGFYSGSITLSVANGFEIGKIYCLRTTAPVGAVSESATRRFRIWPASIPTSVGGGGGGGAGGGGAKVIEPGPTGTSVLSPGGTWRKLVVIHDPDDVLALADPSSLSAVVYRNLVATAEVVTITRLALGKYAMSAVVPSGWAQGDMVEVLLTADFGAVDVAEIVGSFPLTTNVPIPGYVSQYLTMPLGTGGGGSYAYVRSATLPVLTETLQDATGIGIDLSGASSVTMTLEYGGTAILTKAVTVLNALSGRVKVTWLAGDLNLTPGSYRIKWYVTTVDGVLPVQGKLLIITP